MPIRLNLLAETQAAEEKRRRDPVKRIMWIAAILVVFTLIWSGLLQLKTVIRRNSVGIVEAKVASQTNQYQSVLENRKLATDAAHKLSALHQLATNRFLYGNLLNALQHTGVEGVQLLHLKVNQAYRYTAAIKPKTDGGRIKLGKPASATESITITLEAKDFSANPGVQKGPFKDSVATNSYFEQLLGKTNEWQLKGFSMVQSLPGEPPFQTFTLECRLPDKTR